MWERWKVEGGRLGEIRKGRRGGVDGREERKTCGSVEVKWCCVEVFLSSLPTWTT